MTGATDWRTRIGEVWAAEHRRTDRSFANFASRLDAAILAAAPAGSAAALDIGCGAGATSSSLARARADLAITGVDLSPALVAIARARVPTAEFHVADVATDPFDLAPDLLVSRHGVMFFADPVAAFARLRALARPGAALVFSCFADRALNPWAGGFAAAVSDTRPAAPDGYTPGPFAFADRAFVAGVLAAANWTDAVVRAVDFDYLAGEGDDPLADATSFFSRIGPVSAAIKAAPPAECPDLLARLAAALERYRIGARVQLPASAWIWRAQAGDRS